MTARAMIHGRATLQPTVWLHLGGLWAIAVVQPLFDLVGANPEFFVAHRAGRLDILLLVVALSFVLPTLLAGGVGVAGLVGSRTGTSVFYAVLGTLAGLMAMQLAVRAGASSWPVPVAAAAAASAGVVMAYRAWAPARSFFSVLSIATLVVPGVFLSKPGIRSIVWRGVGGSGAVQPNSGHGESVSTPVVLVIFDELPLVSLLDANRHIDADLYPHLAAFAADGVWFRNATTVDEYTKYALPAMLSGRYPSRAALPSAMDYPDTLFTLLAPTHRLEVSEAVTALCPPTLCVLVDPPSPLGRIIAMSADLRVVFLHLVLTSDLTQGLPDPTTTWAGFASGDAPVPTDPDLQPGDRDSDDSRIAADVMRRHWQQGIQAARVAPVRQFIDGISHDDPQPTFYFLHTLVSHQPHHMLPIDKENRTWNLLPGKRGWNRGHSWAVGQHYQRHLLQVGFVDQLVGRLTAQLKSAGLYDRAVIVVTSDHGISHLPNAPQRDLVARTAAEVMRVPLIIKFPKAMAVPSRVSDANVESIDIVPTIADAAGLRVTWAIDGVSLLDDNRPARRFKEMFSGDQRRRHRFAAAGPDLAPALARKLELFGDGARNRQRAPRVPEFDGLIGLPLTALRIADDGPPAEVTDAWEFDHVDLASPAVVFDVSGRFASPRPETYVAVAVNGVIEAVTRTWESNPRGWSATPGFKAWRQGRNDIGVFLIERDQSGLLLRRVTLKDVRPADLNLISAAAAADWGVGQGGFHSPEIARNGTRFRWTREQAELTNVFTYERPRAVQVDVLRVPGDQPKLLTIEANDCQIFRGQVKSGWSSALSLTGCDLSGGGLTLRFSSAAAQTGGDRRRRGVALSRVAVR
jgi:Sulfatase